MEIVINRCYGGFGISNKALLELIRMKSNIVNKTLVKDYYGGNKPHFNKDWKRRYKENISDFNKKFFKHRCLENWLSDGKYVYYIECHDDKVRCSKDLIKVVKKLKKGVNSSHALLKVIEIPNNIKWEIDEYDGIESIEEEHRSWG